MNIPTLIENTQDGNNLLKYENGLSIFIETDDCNVLFDTGKSFNIIYNIFY